MCVPGLDVVGDLADRMNSADIGEHMKGSNHTLVDFVTSDFHEGNKRSNFRG